MTLFDSTLLIADLKDANTCEICKKVFAGPATLKIHQEGHSKTPVEKPTKGKRKASAEPKEESPAQKAKPVAAKKAKATPVKKAPAKKAAPKKATPASPAKKAKATPVKKAPAKKAAPKKAEKR